MKRPIKKQGITHRQVRASLRMYSAASPDSERAAWADSALGLDTPERARAKPRNLEGAEQRALFDWAGKASARHPELRYMFHVPNGGSRDAITGARLKAEGVRRGVPDVFLDVARGGYHGLRIELKAPGASNTKGSAEQQDWIRQFTEAGYRAVICVGWEAAREEIVRYLSRIDHASTKD